MVKDNGKKEEMSLIYVKIVGVNFSFKLNIHIMTNI